MNFSISATQANNFKRFKMHYLVAAAGIALAIGAVIGFGELRRESAGGLSQPAPGVIGTQDSADFGYGVWDTTLADRPVSAAEAPQNVIANHRPDQLLVYVVSSEAEQRALAEDVKNSPEWFGPAAAVNTAVRIVVLEPGTDLGLENLDNLLPEASISIGGGPGLKFVDMR